MLVPGLPRLVTWRLVAGPPREARPRGDLRPGPLGLPRRAGRARALLRDPVLGRGHPQPLGHLPDTGGAGSSSTAASSAGTSRSSSTDGSARSRSGRTSTSIAPSLALGIASAGSAASSTAAATAITADLPWAVSFPAEFAPLVAPGQAGPDRPGRALRRCRSTRPSSTRPSTA